MGKTEAKDRENEEMRLFIAEFAGFIISPIDIFNYHQNDIVDDILMSYLESRDSSRFDCG